MTRKESLSIKGIAIVLMLIHHLFTWGQARYISMAHVILPNNLTIEGFFGVFGKICVTLYLFLSGYGFSCKYLKKPKEKVVWYESLMSAWKVYRKYLLVLIIFLPYGFINHIYSMNMKTVIANIIAFNTSYNQECWFLFVYILIVILILPLLVKWQNKINTKWITLSSLCVIITGYILRFIIVHSSIAWFRDTRLFFNLYYFMLSQFAFVIGWMCKRWKFFEKAEHVHINWILWIGMLVILMVVKVYCPGGMLLDTILTPFFIVLCLKVINLSKISEKILILLGKHSTYMWMTHTFFAFYYWKTFIYGFTYPLIITVVLIVVSFITSCILEKIENKLCKIGRIMNAWHS